MSALPATWRTLVAVVNGGVGATGVRDPGAPCEHFEPGYSPTNGDCDSDGHYLCEDDRCVRLKWCACGKTRATHCGEVVRCPHETKGGEP